MRRLIVPLLLLLAVPAAPAIALEIRGVVLNTEKQPIAGAVVFHRASGRSALTGAEGRFVLAVPDAARTRLEAVHPDFYDQEIFVAAKDAAAPVEIVLVPLIRQREEVVVTALRYPESSVSVPAAETVVPADMLIEEMPANLTEGLRRVPGVSALGAGGFSLVPTIRGLTRRRVLFLIDYARLESDRRTGPSASFVSPDDIDRIEVLRSPSSVLYGSDAIGGVIHVLTKSAAGDGLRGRVSTSYGTVNGETSLGVGVEGGRGPTAFYLSLRNLDAGNYRSPAGEVAQSQYTQRSLFGKLSHRTEAREVHLSALLARGIDVGKTNVNSHARPTWYPRENQNLLQLRWLEKEAAGGEISLQAFVNPNFLETRTDRLSGTVRTQETFARTESTEYGAQLSYGKRWAAIPLRIEAGADVFGRAAAGAVNRDDYLDPGGAVTGTFEETPYSGGARRDYGAFVSVDYAGLRNLDIIGGARWDSLSMEARPGGGANPPSETTKTAATGFLAASWKIAPPLVAFANLSRAFRVPSLSELFYTGISGRGFIVAEPGLRSETSANLDGGIKWVGRRLFAGLYAFRYDIDDMIERYTKAPSIYTYGNIDRGRIQGWELELEYFPVGGWKLFASAFGIRGESMATGARLNDIPPLQALLGTRAWFGRFTTEISAALLSAVDDPGPAETAIPAARVVNLKAGYSFGPDWNLYLTLSNLFDASYIARPDPEAVLEPGRNLRVGVAYAF